MAGAGFFTRRGALAGLALGAGLSAGEACAQISDIHPGQRIEVGGAARLYRLVTPSNLGRNPALAIALHGMGIDSINLMPLYTGLDDLARAQRFVLAYPASFEDHWPLSFGPKLQRELAFYDALVNRLVRAHGCNPRRIYLMGMSNGGYFAHVIAARRSRWTAGLVVHSGGAGVTAIGGVRSQRKFPVFVAHGAADNILPVQLGRDLAALYRREGHPVRYEEVPGLGHIWARDRGINDRIWRFLQSHPTP